MVAPVFRGFTISCTGMGAAEREVLRRRVEQLGAIYSPHLTKTVTHLVASSIVNSPKYQLARELHMTIVMPEWVEDCWTRAFLGAVPLELITEKYRTPIFYGCRISGTGLDVSRRALISEQIGANGGVYRANLTQDCTHLVVSESTGPAEAESTKWQMAKKWKMIIVSEKWVEECCEKKWYLDPRDFIIRSTCPSASQIAPANIFDDKENHIPFLDGCHIYIDESSIAPARLSLLRRIIVSASGLRYRDWPVPRLTHYIVANQTLSAAQLEHLQDCERFGKSEGSSMPFVVHEQWLLDCWERKERTNVDAYLINPEALFNREKPKDPRSKPQGSRDLTLTMAAKDPPPAKPVETRLFDGRTFSVHPELPLLAEPIAKHGGTMVENYAEYFVVPVIADVSVSSAVTELWLLKCLADNVILSPSSDPLFRPTVPTAKITHRLLSHTLCLTGFVGYERTCVTRLIKSLGAICTEELSKKNTALICRKAGGTKFAAAMKRAIPCVKAEWLYECLKKDASVEMEPYLCDPVPEDQGVASNSGSTAMSLTPSLLAVHRNSPRSTSHRPPSAAKRSGSNLTINTPIRLEFSKRLREATSMLSKSAGDDQGHGPSTSQATLDMSPTAPPALTELRYLMRDFTFSISQRLWHRREELHDLLLYPLSPSYFYLMLDEIKIMVFVEGNQQVENFREFRLARDRGKVIVSPCWLVRCREAGIKLDEADYPHTYNPNATKPALHEPARHEEAAETLLTTDEIRDRQKYLEEALAREKEQMERDDPVPTLRIDYDLRPSSTDSVLPTKSRKSAPFFLFSSVPNEQRAIYERWIEQYGGRLPANVAANRWDAACTHLIVSSAARSEKYLAACASGRWVLHTAYLDVCNKEMKFVDEEDYEWRASWSDDKTTAALANAPRHWRLQLAKSGKRGAFEGWRALVVADQKKLPGFLRLLSAGAAETFTIDQLDQLKPRDATHVFLSSLAMRARIPTDWLAELSSDRVYSTEFIAEFLVAADFESKRPCRIPEKAEPSIVQNKS